MRKGFTLIEITVSVAIFALVSAGIYGVIIYVYRTVYLSRVQIIATQVANEKIEIARNLSFENLGTVGGVPSGTLLQTETLARSGMTFQITNTIRNMDDPADGLAGGNPNDTSPADYKLMEIQAICVNCQPAQRIPITLTARLSPKGLEGASKNGTLFVYVFDASGNPVSNASLQIANSKVTPAIAINDVTDINGRYNLVDTATSTEGYRIQISKTGYTNDYTVSSTVANPNPVKSPATVASQTVTEIAFFIDKVSVINLSTQSNVCGAVPSIGFNVRGSKLIGENPSVYRYSSAITTNASGLYGFTNLEWDTYYFNINSASYDIAGTVPTLPLTLNPDATQDLKVILAPRTTNSLLVTVKDSNTKLPLSNATTTLDSTTLVTGYGYFRQTNWVGGSGQVDYIDPTKFFSSDGNIDYTSAPGDIKLVKTGQNYQWNGNLISSTIDFGQPSNFTNLLWQPISQPPRSGANPVSWQIATSVVSNPTSWDFLGPDGTVGTYYTVSDNNINSLHNGRRYLRYKVFLSTENQSYTPKVSEAAISFTSGCASPGQAFFSGLSSGNKILTVSLPGYQTVNTTVSVSGRTTAEVLMSQ